MHRVHDGSRRGDLLLGDPAIGLGDMAMTRNAVGKNSSLTSLGSGPPPNIAGLI